MASALQQAIEIIRQKALNDTEVGTAFERICKVFLENDATQRQQYSKVWHYKDWAKDRPEYNSKDIGIDLVAELSDGSGFCAVQSKCYKSDHPISKSDMDSFISASATKDFVRLLLIDTSTVELGKNAQSVFDNLNQEYQRIQLSELEESRIDWLAYVREDKIRLYAKKELLEHQIAALEKVREGFAEADRGKLIMACGTGKTFTSLRIAEDLAGKGKRVLYMVPSLALMSQTIREWKNDSKEDFTAFSACSDVKVGKRKSSDDTIEVNLHDLAFPATTKADKLADQIKITDPEKMTVVFSTYQSIDVISSAQHDYDLPEFDLIICDEAHRTTGATLVGDDDSTFVRIHNNDCVRGKKRLYMTATPRIFGDTAKKKAEEGEVSLASMDDESKFGKVFFYRGFSWAVENNLLTDYKVVVLMMDEQLVSDRVQKSFTDGAELNLDDATKMVGCFKALAKVGFTNKSGEDHVDNLPMKRALAFCQNISLSKMFSSEFSTVVHEYLSKENEDNPDTEQNNNLKVELYHVDGTFNAEQRNEKLNWLKDDTKDNVCRVLSNARCLSEGVDVPALDAIMFLHPRKSQIDVVQSVGRVMRKAEGKKLGYVIIPIAVAPGVSAEKALNDNEKYKVVWQILNALRAHDERFDSTINRIGLGEDVSERIEIIEGTARAELEATTSVVEDVKHKSKPRDKNKDKIDELKKENEDLEESEEQQSFTLIDLSRAIKAKIVERCGTRDYWENWAVDIAKIAQQHIVRINSIVLNSGTPERQAFEAFVEEIRDDLNPDITETDAIEMLAQHIITRPVFDTLFEGNRFTSENAVSSAMEIVLNRINQQAIDNESKTLEKFYDSVKRRAKDIITTTGRQTLIIELYDRFFKNAFPVMTQKLGIVYTPIEIVDFIINSINFVVEDEFGKRLGNKNIHILDPFTGTGTFITRLMQSGVMSKEELRYKYKSEIHANEIVLLAYYIAAINIESVFQEIFKENSYSPFNGMVLTDTFHLYEQEKDMVANLLPDNSNRRTKQKNIQHITVIMGNPPYSAGQNNSSDNAANNEYPNLDRRIEDTYAFSSDASLKRKLYDSYIRAYRWASDRIGTEGVIGFVTGSGFAEKEFAKGVRKHLCEDFSGIYIINLRGDIRKNMLSGGAAGEGQNVFKQGSMTGIAISILVKNPKSIGKKFKYFDIGDNKSRNEKLNILRDYESIGGIEKASKFIDIVPDENNDWFNQGNKQFRSFPTLGNKRDKSELSIFNTYSLGIATNRDAWCYNFSKEKLINNSHKMVYFYNSSVAKMRGKSLTEIKKSIPVDNTQISWSDTLFNYISRGLIAKVEKEKIRTSIYRPFCKMHLYASKFFNDRQGQTLDYFNACNLDNYAIVVSGVGARSGFSALMVNCPPYLHTADNGQCFPMKTIVHRRDSGGLFDRNPPEATSVLTDNISDDSYQYYKSTYKNASFSKEDLFFYIYGILHSQEYRLNYSNNLVKELPRIPAVKDIQDFMIYSSAGRELSELHANYEQAKLFPVTIKEGNLDLTSIKNPKEFYRVEKMKYGGKKGKLDKTTIIYNKNITLINVPLEVYEYIVGGKSAIDWIIERQCVKEDRYSGIINDVNEYSNETIGNPAYPLELLQRIMTVSIETLRIVSSLPRLTL